MNDTRTTVENLKKVGLTIEAGSEKSNMNIVSDPMYFEFIFGIGTGGLTPFEFEIAGKCTGEEFTLLFHKARIQESFQHIRPPLPAFPEDCSEIYFKCKLTQISQAESREIVSAMAAAADCGDGCCGNH